MFLGFPTFSNLHCTFGFTVTSSHTALSGTHCLLSQAFFWNLCERLPALTNLAFWYSDCISKQYHRQSVVSCSYSQASWGPGWQGARKWTERNKFPKWPPSGAWCPGTFFWTQRLAFLRRWGPTGSSHYFKAFFSTVKGLKLLFNANLFTKLSTALYLQALSLQVLPCWWNSNLFKTLNCALCSCFSV